MVAEEDPDWEGGGGGAELLDDAMGGLPDGGEVVIRGILSRWRC